MNFLRQNLILVLLVLALVGSIVVIHMYQQKDVVDFSSQRMSQCNVSVLAIEGALDTTNSDETVGSLEVSQAIRNIADDGNDALVLLIDSWGGTAAAAEEIIDSLGLVKKPQISFVRGNALSGAYWIAAATDSIVAQRSSLTGGIGVTFSYLDETSLNEIEGYNFNEIVSGQYKETGNVNKELSQAERDYLQSLTDQMYEVFKQDVMQYRNLSESEFEPLADGQAFLGERAKELKLVDAIGGLNEVKRLAAEELDAKVENIVFCEPHEIGTFGESSGSLFGV